MPVGILGFWGRDVLGFEIRCVELGCAEKLPSLFTSAGNTN